MLFFFGNVYFLFFALPLNSSRVRQNGFMERGGKNADGVKKGKLDAFRACFLWAIWMDDNDCIWSVIFCGIYVACTELFGLYEKNGNYWEIMKKNVLEFDNKLLLCADSSWDWKLIFENLPKMWETTF